MKKRLGFPVAALDEIKLRQIVNAFERIGMLLAQHTLAALERALIERLGFARSGPGPYKASRQIVNACERIGMLPAPAPALGLRARAYRAARLPP